MRDAAALFLAYGTPRTPDEVEPYFTHIRGGRRPTDEELGNLRARYEAVGGRTPLVEITERQARGAEGILRDRGRAVRAYVGMKHWHPFVAETVEAIVREGHERIVAVPLAPFYSAVSTGGYEKAVADAVAGRDLSVTFAKEWYDEPAFLASWREILKESLAADPLGGDGILLFTAHSLPKGRMPAGDPYEVQLRSVARKLAAAVSAPAWSLAFQSVGLAGGEWLGPEVHDVLARLPSDGVLDVLVAPLGFVADNLETLYDLDRELRTYAESRGLSFRRTPTPNDRPTFLAALADVVDAHL